MSDFPVITALLITPAVGAVVTLLVPSSRPELQRLVGPAFSVATLGFAGYLLAEFDTGVGQMQFLEQKTWIDQFGIGYVVGVDGISLFMVVLTALLFPMMLLATQHNVANLRAYTFFMLLLEVGIIGVFVSLDLILFFVFWEAMLVPMYFLIGGWGYENRVYAAIKFFLYTIFGSIFMLLGFLGMYFRSDPHTFDIVKLQEFGAAGGFTEGFQLVVFGAVALGFAVKVPMWPFHTWLPDAHTEAPTIGSVLLAGIMLKMGTYGFIRIALPILPEGAKAFAPWIGLLAAIAIVYAALACLAQKDLKRLIAFSSVGHMGFVMLGIATLTEIGIQAAIFGMVAHGVITGMLFFCVGSIYDRYHTREIATIGGGMLQKMPKMASIFTYVSIASLGLPGLAGFWGEVMALLSSFNPATDLGLSAGVFRVFMVMGGIGTILTAAYFLWMLQRVNMGTLPQRWESHPFRDIVSVEWVAWLPLLVLIVALGVFPRVVFGMSDDAVRGILSLLGG
jgi:NADH-quinone oxidoreductase subunit M